MNWFGESGATEYLFWLLRFVAGVGGAFVGWFVSDPLTRLVYRMIAAKPTPGWLLPWTKLGGAALLGLLVFYLIPLGGSGGLGFGPGDGGGAGLGPGKGDDGKGGPSLAKDDGAKKPPDGKKQKPAVTPKAALREPVEIELIGGARYPGEGRYYLLKRQEPAVALEAVEEYFKKHHEKLEVHIVLTEQSVGRKQGALSRLRTLTKEYQIPTVEPPEIEAAAPK